MHDLDFLKLKKNIKKADLVDDKETKLAILSDSSSQFLKQALIGYGVERNMKLNIFEAEYDSIDLEMLNPQSDLYSFEPEFIAIYFSTRKLYKEFHKTPFEERGNFAQNRIERIKAYISSTNSLSKARLILSNYTWKEDMLFANYGNKLLISWAYQLKLLNLKLIELASQNENVFINDLEKVENHFGAVNSFDAKSYIRGDITTSFDILPWYAKNTIDIVQCLRGKFKKCLILDLDNTTWGGIIGDDGIEKIQVGDLGLGKAFSSLQLWAKNLKQRGIILCVCSKNTEHIAKEPFEKHPDMVLRLDDIAVFVANWENKADNIRYIQRVLNIGFDSMVFLDDNPMERNLIRSEIPEVLVPELPEDPSEYVPYLSNLNLFETISYSNTDTDRTKMYQDEASRSKLEASYENVGDFMKNLEMEAIAAPFDSFNVPRIAQLTQRSNQFNLRTVRYTEGDVTALINSDKHNTMYVSLKDKFGNYGLISVLIMEKISSDELFIDTWIMSCRVLKRNVEQFVLNKLIKVCNDGGFKTLVGERLPTKKNVLVENHYSDLGFKEEGGKWYLDVASYEESTVDIKEVNEFK